MNQKQLDKDFWERAGRLAPLARVGLWLSLEAELLFKNPPRPAPPPRKFVFVDQASAEPILIGALNMLVPLTLGSRQRAWAGLAGLGLLLLVQSAADVASRWNRASSTPGFFLFPGLEHIFCSIGLQTREGLPVRPDPAGRPGPQPPGGPRPAQSNCFSRAGPRRRRGQPGLCPECCSVFRPEHAMPGAATRRTP